MSGDLGTSANPQQESEKRRPTWGPGEATIGWIAAQFVATATLVGVSAAGFSIFRPQRPGGFLGRAVGQNRTGEFTDDSLPLFWQMLIQVPTWIVMLAVTWVVAGAIGRARPGWSLRGEPLDVARGLGAGFLLQIPIVIIVVSIVTLIFGEQIPSGRPQALVDSIDGPLDLIALVAVVAIGAPIVEELFYRGVVQRSLVERIGPVLGIGITGLVFGAVHFSLVELAPLTVVGIGFGVLAHKYGRLLPAIVAHMTFNAVALIAVLASA